MNINGMEFTIGADPEVFVSKGGVPVSAYGMIKGDKRNPFKVAQGAVQVDGMALEYNIDPAHTEEEFLNNLEVVKNQLKDMIGDAEFCDDISVHFDEKYLESQPPEAKELGCDPDYNAYTKDFNPTPDGSTNLRTVGGHVHVGGFFVEDADDPQQRDNAAKLACLLDEEVGVYSTLWDKDDERRSLYGVAGSFRPKTYGMEYRTMSNKWTTDKRLASFVYRGVERALARMFEPYEPNQEIREIIDTSDRNHPFFNSNPLADEIKSIVGA